MHNPDMREDTRRVLLLDGVNVHRERLAEQKQALSRVLTQGEVSPWDRRILQDAEKFLEKLHEDLV